jgi:hypothetical protein
MPRALIRLPQAALTLVLLLAAMTGAQAQVITIEAPNFQGGAFFGDAIATLDGNRFIVGAPGIDEAGNDDVGRAYLFNATGGLLTTFISPTVTPYSYFGSAVAGLTSNRVIVGAREEDTGGFFLAGRAYLFRTNGGAALATFDDPTPADSNYFATAVTAVGSNWVLIGAPGVNEGAKVDVGRAFLFRTNGTLARTFTNPVPNANANFGVSVAALDRDRILIGAFQQTRPGASFSGEAYLFHTNGTLLATLTNPVPHDYAAFAYSLAVLDSERIVIGAYGARRAGLIDVGEVFLLRTNGAVLAALTNPLPSSYASFGGAVAVVDGDKILVGADGATRNGVTSTGEAYLFSTNGTLLTTFTNPANGALNLFGWALAPVSSNYLAITANQHTFTNLTSTNSFVGRTYLMPLPALPGSNVSLTLNGAGPDRQLSWLTIPHRILQETTNLTPPVVWTDSALTVTTNGVTNRVTVPAASGPALRAFRLRLP